MSQTHVLVTGATGFIGRALIPQLIKRTTVSLLLLEEFAGGTELPPPLKHLRADFDVVYADLRNYHTTARALRQANPDQVIHLAGVGSTDPFLNPHTAVSHNVTGTLNLLKACFQTDLAITKLVVARTPGEYSAMNPYAVSKAAAWAFCLMYARTAGWPICGAMIYQAYGFGQPEHLLIPAALRAAMAGEDFPMTAGHQEKDWIYIDDIVESLIRMLQVKLPFGDTLEIGTGHPTAVREVVQIIYDLVSQGGKPLFGSLPTRPGEEIRQVANSNRLNEYLGWRPGISLREGIARLITISQSRPLIGEDPAHPIEFPIKD
jgi:nucleoside-diphosphate-sugar epimerase